MNQQIQSLVRSLLKAGGIYLVGQGFGDEAGMEMIVGGVMTFLGFAWSWFNHLPGKDV